MATARALAGTGDKEGLQMAEDLLRVILERQPDSLSTLMVLGMLMQSQDRNDEAAVLNRKILELDPNNIVAINNLAWVLCEEQGQREEALQLAEKGVRLAPEYVDLIDTRGVIHYRLGHLEKAVADFTKSIALCPANTPASTALRFHLARAYAQMGRKTEALDQLNEALRIREALESQGRAGGLSNEDMADTKLLLEQLQKGS
jgi:tetratricopeptide (TPR) repeat protein